MADVIDIDGQAYRPVVVFLNGAYWGIHNLREKLNEHYPAGNYNLDPESIDLLKRYPNENWNIVSGDADHYLSMLDYLDSHTMADPDAYDTLSVLRRQPTNISELEATLGIPPKELKQAIQTLKKFRVVSEKRRKGPSGEYDKWLFLLNDIRVRLFFPEYFLSTLVTELEKTPDDSRLMEMVHQHLRLLRDNFPR